MDDDDDPNRRQSSYLALWAIPEDLIAAAPDSPYSFDPKAFIDADR